MFYFILYKIGRVLALILPIKVGYWLACRWADLCYSLSKRNRKLLKDNLSLAMGVDQGKVEDFVRGAFRNFGKYLVDFFRFSKIDTEFIKKFVKVEGRENLDQALAKNRGVIITSAHLGNWELGAVVTSLLGYPVNVIALAHENKRVNDFFIRQRSRKGIGVIPVEGAVKKSFNTLARKQIVCFMADRDFSKSGIDVEFFGKVAQVPSGGAAFSLKSGSPIVPTFMVREPDDTFRLVYERPIEYKSTNNLMVDLRNITRKCLEVIEGWVKRYPSQWYIFSQVWKGED